MRIAVHPHLHSYLDDPLPPSLHRGYERLAIEQALLEEQLQRRGRLRRAVVSRLQNQR